MKVHTVNVIEMRNDTIDSIQYFNDDKIGNEEAEECFKDFIRGDGDNVSDEEMNLYIKEGYWEQGDIQLFLTHSS